MIKAIEKVPMVREQVNIEQKEASGLDPSIKEATVAFNANKRP